MKSRMDLFRAWRQSDKMNLCSAEVTSGDILQTNRLFEEKKAKIFCLSRQSHGPHESVTKPWAAGGQRSESARERRTHSGFWLTSVLISVPSGLSSTFHLNATKTTSTWCNTTSKVMSFDLHEHPFIISSEHSPPGWLLMLQTTTTSPVSLYCLSSDGFKDKQKQWPLHDVLWDG